MRVEREVCIEELIPVILQSDLDVRKIDLFMDISAGLEYKLLKCNTPEDAKLFSIKSLDKALQDQIYYKLKVQLW